MYTNMSVSEGFGFKPRRKHLPYGTSGGSLCGLHQHTQISPLWDEPHLSSTYNYYTKHSLYISPLVGVPTGEFNDTWLLQYLQKPSVTQSNLNKTETDKNLTRELFLPSTLWVYDLIFVQLHDIIQRTHLRKDKKYQNMSR